MNLDDTVSALQCKSPLGSGGLWLVPTPIGNLRDMTLRAIDVLRDADVIACEDTRTSQVLLRHYEISTPLVSYHEHNGPHMRPKLLARMQAGQQVALISDAGTPLISDPGYKLVVETQEAGISVTALPGACAAITALAASGLPSGQFAFLGFLPAKEGARRSLLTSVKAFAGTLIVYESPRRLLKTIALIEAVLGERELVMARELTKRFEEMVRLPASELRQELQKRSSLKGEVVLLIGACGDKPLDEASLTVLLRKALQSYGTKEAAAQVAAQTGASKRDVYQQALALKADDDSANES